MVGGVQRDGDNKNGEWPPDESLDPKSDDRTPAPESGALAAAAHQIAENAVQGELLAMETESDEVVYWIVEATKDSSSSPPAVAPLNYKPPKLGSDIAFDYGRAASSNRPTCIQVKRLKPVTTRRGQDSVRLLEVDEKTPPFLAPSKLLRAGKLKLKKTEIASRPSRSRMSPSSRVQYELTKEQRTRRNWSSNADTTRDLFFFCCYFEGI